jgi:hypothetical protein
MIPFMNAQASLARAARVEVRVVPRRGSSLPDDVRRSAEELLGEDLSDVRVHVSAAPGRMGAVAFTTGSNIYFAPRRYDPGSPEGLRLLGHELTHVVQQRRGRARNPHGYGVAVVRDPQLEAEADRMGRALQLARQPALHGGGRRGLAVQPMMAVPAKVVIQLVGPKVVGVVDGTGRALPFAVDGVVDVGGVVVSGGGKKPWGARFRRGENDYVKIAKVEAEEIVPLEEVAEVDYEALEIVVYNGILSDEPPPPVTFTSFESNEKGQAHFEKHGAEVHAKSLANYLKMAKAFGAEKIDGLREAIIDRTVIRVDPETEEHVRVLIVNNRQLRTFYVWDPAFSSDPFVFAIYYTITSSKGIPLRSLSPQTLAYLEEQDVDLFAMEIEEIDRQVLSGRKLSQIEAATLAPRELISKRRDVARMERDLGKRSEGPHLSTGPSKELSEEELAELLKTARELGIDV